MKIRKGFWYLCSHGHNWFLNGYWYYSPEDGFLNGGDNKPNTRCGFHRKYFSDCEEFRFVSPKG